MIAEMLFPLGYFWRWGYKQHYARVAELVDATDLDNLSALVETLAVELLKFGGTFHMAIPSQA